MIVNPFLLISCLALPVVANASVTAGMEAREFVAKTCPKELSQFEALVSQEEVESFWTQTSILAEAPPEPLSLPMKAVMAVGVLDTYSLNVVRRSLEEYPDYVEQALQNSKLTRLLAHCMMANPSDMDLDGAAMLLGWHDCVEPIHEKVNAKYNAGELSSAEFEMIVRDVQQQKPTCGELPI